MEILLSNKGESGRAQSGNMATSGGLTVLLLVFVLLQGYAYVSATSFGQRHFFHLAEFEENGCLPERFEQDLPPSLWVNAMSCRHQHPVDSVGHHFSHDTSVAVPSQDQKRALYLHCLAKKLGIITDAGIAEDRLDAFIESLPAGEEMTSAWKSNADVCVGDMSSDLTPGQQAVFLLSCLRQRLAFDCARGTDMLCIQAKSFLSVRFLQERSSLDNATVWRRCAARHVQENQSAFTDSKRTSPDFCPALLDRAVWIASCALRGTGHASGDSLNVTAVWESLRQGDGTFDSSRLAEVMQWCQSSSVKSFALCWAEETPPTAVNDRAHRLAMALPPSP